MKPKLSHSKVRAELTSRNVGLINTEHQEAIHRTKILLVGCGLGSQIAVLAARVGFENFSLYDGDTVELHNLNRQAYEITDLGKNKALATKKKILQINPHAKVKAKRLFLRDQALINREVKEADIVVNMADPDDTMYTINGVAKENGKLVLFPLNFGYGAYVLALTPGSQTLEEIIGDKLHGDSFYGKLIEKTLPHYPELLNEDTMGIMQVYENVLRGEHVAPQLGISAYMTAVLTVKAMIRWLGGYPMPTAPKPIIFEPGK